MADEQTTTSEDARAVASSSVRSLGELPVNQDVTAATDSEYLLTDAELAELSAVPEIVELRMDYAKDVVQMARGSGCSWK